MPKKIIWILICCLMSVSLLVASCSSKDEESPPTAGGNDDTGTTETAEKPVYGGEVTLSLLADVDDFLPWSIFTAEPVWMCNDWLWNGDWTKGPAGGYGSNEVGWETSTNIKSLKANYLAQDIRWEVDEGGTTGTLYITMKPGIHFALDESNPASVMVGGREVTIDDVLWNFNTRMNDTRTHPGLFLGTYFPWTNGIYGEKVSDQEAKFTMPIEQLLNGVMLLCDGAQIMAPELDEQWAEDSTVDWHVCTGAGAFTIQDYVAGNTIELKRNDNYWMTNPIGPGMGDRLPYLDTVKYIVMQDASTRLAAIRTGQLDQMANLSIEDRALLVQQKPDLKEAVGGFGTVRLLGMRTDLEGTPYANEKVRRAMMMATDFNEINDSLYEGLGQILTWPYWYQKGYEKLYLGLNDADMPASIKELYEYNPEKAKQLLTEAGYPDGFKAEIVMTTVEVDYYSIIKDMWAKVGIDLDLNAMEDGAYNGVLYGITYENMIVGHIPPPSSWPEVAGYTGVTLSNFSRIDDAFVNQATDHMLTTAITDLDAAMTETRELMKYLLEGAWVIPAPRYPSYILWWPWVKNYSGETSVGWLATVWPRWVYVDQNLKSEMGY